MSARHTGEPEPSFASELCWVDECRARFAQKATEAEIAQDVFWGVLDAELVAIEEMWARGEREIATDAVAKKLLVLICMHTGINDDETHGVEKTRALKLATRDWLRPFGIWTNLGSK